MRRTVIAAIKGAWLTPKNSHESIIVSMTFNAQAARSIDEDLLCVSFINICKET